MGSLDKRIEDLERRLGPREPVLIRVVYETSPDEVLYTVTVPAPEHREPPLGETPEQERGGGA